MIAAEQMMLQLLESIDQRLKTIEEVVTMVRRREEAREETNRRLDQTKPNPRR